MEDKNLGFEEIHITKREDGEGFQLKARAVWKDGPCTIDVPLIKQPNLSINHKKDDEYLYGQFLTTKYQLVNFHLSAEIKPENEKYYTITIDPEVHARNQVKKLEQEIEEIKTETEEKLESLINKVRELKKTVSES